jgi:hypothetical protein
LFFSFLFFWENQPALPLKLKFFKILILSNSIDKTQVSSMHGTFRQLAAANTISHFPQPSKREKEKQKRAEEKNNGSVCEFLQTCEGLISSYHVN